MLEFFFKIKDDTCITNCDLRFSVKNFSFSERNNYLLIIINTDAFTNLQYTFMNVEILN